MRMSVCRSFTRICLEQHSHTLQKLCVLHVGSVVIWQRCDMLCTSGFVDDVMFYTLGPMARRIYFKRRKDNVTAEINASNTTKF